MRIWEVVADWKKAREVKPPRLFHISQEGDLDGWWTPRNPAGEPGGIYNQYREPDLPRISLAPTIRGCFSGVYPNISAKFEEENLPYVDFHIYEPHLTGEERVITNDELTTRRMVMDAHVTGEWCIVDPVMMKHVGKIRIYNTAGEGEPFITFRPFDDPQYAGEEIGLAPMKFKYQLLSGRDIPVE